MKSPARRTLGPVARKNGTQVIIGIILGLYWRYIGVTLGLCWGYIGVILGLVGFLPVL